MKFIQGHSKQSRLEPSAEYFARADIHLEQVKEMYDIYASYYENTNFELFLNDLNKKSGAILVFHPVNKSIVGFSTMVVHHFKFGRKNYTFLFSGDTVIMREFWGSRAFQAAFMRFKIRMRFQYPLDELYWLLISKGYKTYLLMANNYYIFYPNIDSKFESLSPVLKHYCNTFFPDYYDESTGLLNFGDDYQPLKGEVAPITEQMRRNNPKIRFFESLNPTWEQGTELPCIGYLGWRDLMRYPVRFLSKSTSKGKHDAIAYQPVKQDGQFSC